MQFGPRLMRRVPPFGPPEEEMNALRRVLSSCPGVARVLSIAPHHKGGYVAVFDFERQHLDGYIEHLESRGWMNVF